MLVFQFILFLLPYRAPKTAGNLAGDFAEVAFWVLKNRCPEGGNLNVEQVNTHLDNIALKHAAHDPSKIFHFSEKSWEVAECK
jgi:DNA ligase-4